MQIPVSHIFRRDDARKIDAGALKGLIASIEEVGIINPLRVRPVRRNVNGEPADAYEVTAGHHRLKAAVKLGLETVPCIVVDDDDLHAELAMIDENLCRAELSPADRATQTARRKEIYVALHPETANGSNQHTRVGQVVQPNFAEATAEAIGKDERTVRRDAERGEKIAADVLAKVKGSHLDTGVYLDGLKKLEPDEQRAKVDRALSAPKPKPVRLADPPLNDFEAKEKWLAAGMAWWDRGSKEWREEFLGRVDQPIMDSSRAA